MNFDYIIHHTDADGWASAAILGASVYQGGAYGRHINSSELVNNASGRRVAMVDFSLPPEQMTLLARVSKEFVWIDHHLDSAHLKSLPGITGIHDTNKAGCELTWEYAYPGEPMPDVIRYVGDRDIRRNAEPDARAYCCGLNIIPGISEPGSHIWQDLLDGKYTQDILSSGRPIMYQQDTDSVWHGRLRVHKQTLKGQPFLLTNCTSNVSDTSDSLIRAFGVPVCLLWDIAKGGVKLHGRGENVRDFFYPLLKGHPNACGGGIPLPEGWEFLRRMYDGSIRVTP